jgi:2-keto-4-pentenoate hydratase/2-oxohepta-3-ene-1,7-dioic acid hydratase in catechol pathway
MKLASFHYAGEDRIGAVAPDGRLVDLAVAEIARHDRLPTDWPQDMMALIEAGVEGLARARGAFEWALGHPNAVAAIAADRVTWQPPVRRPSKICCLALNNTANADRILSGPKHPAIFVKGSNALVGHDGAIVVKQQYGRVHPEPELAVVIGRTTSNITAAVALDHVFGYTVHNDITSPTMRSEDTFHYRAIHPAGDGSNEIKYVDSHVSYPGRYKGSDTFSPLGPWIVTRDEIDDPHALDVICRHKGEIVTEDNTRNLFHKVPEVLAFISEYMTLLPGDVVSMGTALKRVGSSGKAVQNVDLYKLGGPVSVTIEKIGTLSNTVQLFESPLGDRNASVEPASSQT